MHPRYAIELVSHDPRWPERAAAEASAIANALGACIVAVHHIGSTAIPSIRAKPIIDLLPVVTNLAALDSRRGAMEALGYLHKGEFGLPGRRYFIRSEPGTGRRLFHVHCYERGSPEIDRHLAFRDHVRSNPELARQYEQVKIDCRTKHPQDQRAYSLCKSAWIDRIEAEARA